MQNNNDMLQSRPYPAVLSIVIPMYNEESVIPHLRNVMNQFMREVKGETEVVLVNDGSTDSTLAKVAAWASEDSRIKVISLSRNFGHQGAATAGLDHASGDAIVLLDADLQDPVSVIHQMINHYCEGYEVVYGQRVTRQGEGGFKRLSAWLFYRLMNSLVYKDLPVDTGDFRLISKSCLEGLQQLRETHRFLRGMVAWVGYPQIAVKYERAARVAGETKYPLRKMLTFAWTAATSFSAVPLKFSIWLGLIVTIIGFEEAVRASLAHVFRWYTVRGWSSLTVLISLLGGATLMSIGVVGLYVAKIYEQVKNRPLYLVYRTYNVSEPAKCHRIVSVRADRAALDKADEFHD